MNFLTLYLPFLSLVLKAQKCMKNKFTTSTFLSIIYMDVQVYYRARGGECDSLFWLSEWYRVPLLPPTLTTLPLTKPETSTHLLVGLLTLNNWLVENSCPIVCMESTGKYWIPVFNILENYCSITLANPRFVKNIPGKKTDKRDSV